MVSAERKRDIVAVIPTGSGKSVIQDFLPQAELECFGSPPRITVVLFPLLCVMEDRRQSVQDLGYAVQVFKRDTTIASLGNVPRLFIQGEYLRLAQPLLHALERLGRLSRIIVDEVHVFQEDDDYRPVYADLIHVVTSLPMVPVIATTGTLTREMEHRLISDLLLGMNYISIRRSANMPHHSYNVIRVNEGSLYSHLSDAIKRQALLPEERAIIYCLKKDRCIEIQNYLTSQGHSAFLHHSDIVGESRELSTNTWKRTNHSIMVATKGFLEGVNFKRIPLIIFTDGIISPIKGLQGSGRGGRHRLFPSCNVIILYNPLYLQRYRNITLCSPDAVQLMENNLCRRYQLLGAVDGIGLFCSSFMAQCDICGNHNMNGLSTFDITQDAAANSDLFYGQTQSSPTGPGTANSQASAADSALTYGQIQRPTKDTPTYGPSCGDHPGMQLKRKAEFGHDPSLPASNRGETSASPSIPVPSFSTPLHRTNQVAGHLATPTPDALDEHRPRSTQFGDHVTYPEQIYPGSSRAQSAPSTKKQHHNPYKKISPDLSQSSTASHRTPTLSNPNDPNSAKSVPTNVTLPHALQETVVQNRTILTYGHISPAPPGPSVYETRKVTRLKIYSYVNNFCANGISQPGITLPTCGVCHVLLSPPVSDFSQGLRHEPSACEHQAPQPCY